MNQWLDNITYGNPPDRYLPYLKKAGYASLFPELLINKFPANSSEAAQDELRELIAYQNSEEQKNEKMLGRYIIYDKELINIFKRYAREKMAPIEKEGENIEELIDNCIADIMPILMQLKYKFQRPRPYQLAQYYKARLFPFKSSKAATPSYPSGHTFQAAVLTELLGNKFPEHYNYLTEMTSDIATSRLFLGLHYPSDNDFAYKCAKAVASSKEFTQKYGI